MAASLLPIVIPGRKKEWVSAGISGKPAPCSSCRFSYISTGFCADHYPATAKVALLLPYPGTDEIVERKPLAGGVGKFLLWKYVHDIGRRTDEIAASYVLRCRVPYRAGKPAYPTGMMRSNAESVCRDYDNQQGASGKLIPGGLLAFNPNLFLITFDPADVFGIPAYHRQIKVDFRKAFKFADEGYRVMVLCGGEATELVAPWTSGRGGCKAWRGHWWQGEFPFGGQKISSGPTLAPA